MLIFVVLSYSDPINNTDRIMVPKLSSIFLASRIWVWLLYFGKFMDV